MNNDSGMDASTTDAPARALEARLEALNDMGATTPPETTSESYKARKYVFLTAEIKTEASVLWRAGNMTMKELAGRWGVNPMTLGTYLRKNKVNKGEVDTKLAQRRAAVVEEALTLDPLVHARRVFDTKNETYRIAEMLRKLVATEIVKCRQEGRKLGSIMNEIKVIKDAASAIKLCREEAFAVLGVRPEDQGDEALPELVVTDLSEDDIAQLQGMPTEADMGDATASSFSATSDDDDSNNEVSHS